MDDRINMKIKTYIDLYFRGYNLLKHLKVVSADKQRDYLNIPAHNLKEVKIYVGFNYFLLGVITSFIILLIL